jgi:hypothetical protein
MNSILWSVKIKWTSRDMATYVYSVPGCFLASAAEQNGVAETTRPTKHGRRSVPLQERFAHAVFLSGTHMKNGIDDALPLVRSPCAQERKTLLFIFESGTDRMVPSTHAHEAATPGHTKG